MTLTPKSCPGQRQILESGEVSQSDGCALESEWECTEWTRHRTQGLKQSKTSVSLSIRNQSSSSSLSSWGDWEIQTIFENLKQGTLECHRVSNIVTWVSPVPCSLTLVGLAADLKGKVGETGPGISWLVRVAQGRGRNDGPSVSLPLGISTRGYMGRKEGGGKERAKGYGRRVRRKEGQ